MTKDADELVDAVTPAMVCAVIPVSGYVLFELVKVTAGNPGSGHSVVATPPDAASVRAVSLRVAGVVNAVAPRR